MSDGITHLGDDAEERFREQTGAVKPVDNFEGDAILRGYPVEVKKADGGTVNQVRPARYTTLAVYVGRESTWYVIPPHEVVKMAAARQRGQHTENPFECITLTVKTLPARFKLVNPTRQRLLSRALAAIAEGENHKDIQMKMTGILEDSRRLASGHISQVRGLFTGN